MKYFIIFLIISFCISLIILSKFKYKIKESNRIIKKLKLKNEILNLSFNLNNSFIQDHNDNIYMMILNKAISLIDGCEKGSFLVYDPDSYSFSFSAVKGYNFDTFKNAKIGLDETFIYRNSDNEYNEPVIIKNIHAHNEKYMSNKYKDIIKNSISQDFEETLSIPIKINDSIFGIINLDSKVKFTKNQIENLDLFSKKIAEILHNNELLEKTIYLSKYDKLTNIYNRSYFEEVFRLFSKHSMRYNTSYSFVLIDLNYLKQINDNFGHNIGDKALTYFVNTIKKNIRETDIFARLGGDEFVIILKEADYDIAKNKMDIILNKFLNNKFQITSGNKNKSFNITFSYGIAISPIESMVFDILLRLADKRMYEFKTEFKMNHPNMIPK